VKLTIFNVEAPGHEINEVPAITDLIKRMGNSLTATAVQGADSESDIYAFLRSRGRENPQLALVKDFVDQCLAFGSVEAVPGTSSGSPDGLNTYLMLRHTSHRYGAFAYVTPSSGAVGLRLDRSHADQSEHARATQSKDPYQVRIHLTSQKALMEATQLARAAYERVTP
jgi:hypothetical protein